VLGARTIQPCAGWKSRFAIGRFGVEDELDEAVDSRRGVVDTAPCICAMSGILRREGREEKVYAPTTRQGAGNGADG
jgi:hypothetical protein